MSSGQEEENTMTDPDNSEDNTIADDYETNIVILEDNMTNYDVTP